MVLKLRIIIFISTCVFIWTTSSFFILLKLYMLFENFSWQCECMIIYVFVTILNANRSYLHVTFKSYSIIILLSYNNIVISIANLFENCRQYLWDISDTLANQTSKKKLKSDIANLDAGGYKLRLGLSMSLPVNIPMLKNSKLARLLRKTFILAR